MDLMKDAQTLMSAYSDAGLVTEKFILNIFQRMNKELKANFNLANFRLNTQLKLGTHDTIGRIEIYVKSLKNQMFFFVYIIIFI